MSAPPRIASPKMLQEPHEEEEDVRQTHMPSSWPSEVDEDPLLGHLIGSFELTRRLGRGGMGTVYLGQHVDIGSRVAIKVLHERLASYPNILRRFQTEARAVNLIGHENIVSIIDIHSAPPRPYLIMEYLDGQPLSSLLSRGPVPPELAVALLTQVCDALSATHARGIVHRDLKPENIFLLERRQGPPFVKVLDFGIAKLLDDERGSDTGEGVIIGSADYMAPEQSLGDALDGRADLYAIGVIAYQLLTGRLPFEERSLTAQLLAHQTQPPPPPRALRPELPPALAAAILRSLAKAPAERFPDAATMRDALLGSLGPRCASGTHAVAAPGALPGRPPHCPELTLRVKPGPDAPVQRLPCSDLTRGGMFLRTEGLLPPLFSLIQVQLELHTGEHLTCTCEVVRHVSPAEARAWSMAPGFGVQFQEPSTDWTAAVGHLLRGQPLCTLLPPSDPVAEAEVERALAPYTSRDSMEHYTCLALPENTSFEAVRLRAHRAAHALERLRARPLSQTLRTRVDSVRERLRQAGETLGTPGRRAAYDAERGNYQGVALCLATGLPPSRLEELRLDFLARHPHVEEPVRTHLATARTLEAAGQLSDARAAYERALTLDPLWLELHREYLLLCRRLEQNPSED